MSAANTSGSSIQKRLDKPGGALRKYCGTVVGPAGLLSCLAYELIMVSTASISGIPGVLIRRLFYPLLLEGLGRNVYLGKDVIFRRPNKVRIGDDSIIGNGVAFDVKMEGRGIQIDRNVCIDDNTLLSCIGGILHVEKKSQIGGYCRLGSYLGLHIGQRCIIGNRVCIVGAGHSYASMEVPIIEQPLTCRGMTQIGNDVNMGDEVTLLDGVQLGDHVTIAPGSFVNRNVEAGAYLSGVPAQAC